MVHVHAPSSLHFRPWPIALITSGPGWLRAVKQKPHLWPLTPAPDLQFPTARSRKSDLSRFCGRLGVSCLCLGWRLRLNSQYTAAKHTGAKTKTSPYSGIQVVPAGHKSRQLQLRGVLPMKINSCSRIAFLSTAACVCTDPACRITFVLQRAQ